MLPIPWGWPVAPGGEQAQLAGAAPLALVVGVEDLAPGRGADARGGAKAGAHGLHLSVGRDAQGVTAPLDPPEGLVAEGLVGRDPVAPVCGPRRTEVVLVVVATELPPLPDRDLALVAPITVGVLDAKELAAAGAQEPGPVPEETERFVQALSDLGHRRGGVRCLARESVHGPDLAAPRNAHDAVAAVGARDELEAADLEDAARGEIERGDRVSGLLTRPPPGILLRCGRDAETDERGEDHHAYFQEARPTSSPEPSPAGVRRIGIRSSESTAASSPEPGGGVTTWADRAPDSSRT